MDKHVGNVHVDMFWSYPARLTRLPVSRVGALVGTVRLPNA